NSPFFMQIFSGFKHEFKWLPIQGRELINAITTNTTHFFREPHHFDYLQTFLRELYEKRKRTKKHKLRLWCAASSTGQEPYSIAMTMNTVFSGIQGWDAKLLASDIDTNALTVASRGEYRAEELETVPEEYLSRYFNALNGTGRFQIKPSVRSSVVFRRINLINDAFAFTEPIDVVFCRNVMIYFSRENRSKLLHKIYDILSPDGIMFLGHAESIQLQDRYFEPIGTTVYRKRQRNAA
ncbi:MAG: protein-glutamate O-methyltransferase CheR, partial [Deltaproteobacteria bacterium]|nr:protein-glutamate O-methyltransferase CheR [Deltaproteobacteria bacterium]